MTAHTKKESTDKVQLQRKAMRADRRNQAKCVGSKQNCSCISRAHTHTAVAAQIEQAQLNRTEVKEIYDFFFFGFLTEKWESFMCRTSGNNFYHDISDRLQTSYLLPELISTQPCTARRTNVFVTKQINHFEFSK